MPEVIYCIQCHSEFTYQQADKMVCSQCFHEWNPKAVENKKEEETKILDANGNALADGDDVIVLKDLPVKGAPKPIKAGTKVKNIRLRPENDHNIDCKVDGFGAMALKSEFLRKA